MIFAYRKLSGDLGKVEIAVSDDFTFDEAVAYLKHELMLDEKTRVLGVLTKDDYKENV